MQDARKSETNVHYASATNINLPDKLDCAEDKQLTPAKSKVFRRRASRPAEMQPYLVAKDSLKL